MFESREKERQTDRDRERETQRDRDRQKERQRRRQRQRETETQRERKKVSAAVTCLDIWISDVINKAGTEFQALVYDILPSTTAVFSYAIGARKLPANEQFFVLFYFLLLVLKQ